ncbi:hypothetical protein JL720_1634 [Aureococcus anophagefferens]|nr:hypothetical protein JL720_1634 [Aureococcus anophagefferens]
MAANVDVDSMGVKAMKELIKSAGLSHADCCEKADLRNRSREALARLAEANVRRPAPAPGAPETATFGKWPTIVKYANGATRDAHDLIVAMLHGVNAPPDDLVPLCDPMGQLLGGTRCVFAFPSAGPQWWDLDPNRWAAAAATGEGALASLIREPPAGFDACRSDGLAFVAALRETFPQGALVLGGFSQGAMTATDLALSLPKDAPLAGILHMSGAPLVVEKWARDLAERRHHILISHGEADPTLPFVAGEFSDARDEAMAVSVVLVLLAARASALCILRNKTFCWGNEHRYVNRTGSASPFEGIVGSTPAFADLDGDGDLDLVVSGSDGTDDEPHYGAGTYYYSSSYDGTLDYYKNNGNATSRSYEAVTGAANPFDGIAVHSSGSTPAFGDLDGDGDLDLVVGDEDGTLFYYENAGSAASPSYEARTGNDNPFDDVDVGRNSAPAFGDLDGDGDLDLVVGEFRGALFYYENVGNATSPSYEAAIENPFDGIDVGLHSAPALGDLDADGDLDLVVGEYDGALYYYENAGSGASPSYMAVTGTRNPFDGIDGGDYSRPAIGDLDGDGDLVLVVGVRNGDLYYYEIEGPAVLPSYAAVIGSANPFDGIDVGSFSKPAFGDLDGDLDLDLAVGEKDGGLYYYENVGSAASPSYAAVTGSASPFDGIYVGSRSKPALGDIDGDGDLDLVVGEFDGGLSYYENVGSAASPTYAGRRRDANPFDGIDVGTDSAGRGFSTPALVDLDGDGDLDLVLGEEEGVLNYYENVGSATSPTYAVVSGDANPFDGIDVGSYSAPAFSDLDGDSDLDLVVGRDAGVLNYYENVGSAASPSYVAVTGNENPFDGIDVSGLWDSSAPALGDIDGDGDLDLVVGAANGFLNFFANGYCTQGDTACGSKGLCDTGLLASVVFSEAYCQCLGGFDHEVPGVVEQCGECQAGFYGKTCEPCPQGGNEDRNAPRLTDTCGIAGSGRSRGSCDDGIRGDGTCACFGDVFSGSGCTNGTCPAGTVENATFDGYYNNAACTPCDAGTFSAEGDDECTKCASGKFSAERASECAICSAGSYSGPGANVCSSCAIRTYQDETGSPNCKLADAGFFVDSLGASEQTACDAGKYSGSAASECIACEAGTYQGATGEFSCALADAGFFVDSLGASKQVACDAGKYSGSGAKACIDCEAGTYQGAIGESSCKIAEAGSFVDVAGASRQRPCPAGSFSGSAASECVDCEAGTYVPRSGAVAAVIADAGYVVEVEGASEQTKCPPGSYSGAKASACALCDPGRFANLEATASCTFALPGTYAWVAGAVAASVCPAGRYSASGASSCDLCPDGQTSDEGSATCAPVDAGLTNAELSTITFEVGTGLVLSGLDAVRFPDDDAAREAFASAVREIVNAPGGGAVFDVSAEDVHLSAGRRRLDAAGSDAVRFARAYELASSLAMVRGETALEIGELFAATDALVVACPPGTYSTSGAASCTPCQPGTYTDAPGQAICKLASPGTFVPVEGASTATPCPVGTFSKSTASSCTPCPRGSYSNLTEQSTCALCATPTTTLREGKTYCDACIGDYYWDRRRYVQHADETPLAESGQPLPCKDCCLECDGACAVDGDDCVSCPAGTTLESMDLKKNYWRVSERAKKIYECTLEKSCDGGWNSSCAPGHKGPLCGSCEAHFFYDAVKNRCEDCRDKIKATGSNIVGTILAALLLLSVVGVVVRRFGLSEVWTNAAHLFREVAKGEAPEDIATEKMEEQDEPVQAKKSVVVDVEESAANEALEEAETAFLSAARRCFDMIDADGSGTLTRMEIAEAVAGNDEVVEFLRTCGDDNLRLLLEPGRIDVALHVLDPSGDGAIDADEWEAAVQRGPGACLDGQGEAAAKRGAVTKLKIVIATYQIVTSITWTLPQVRFPAAFDRMLKLFSFVNLSLISFAKPECWSFRYSTSSPS